MQKALRVVFVALICLSVLVLSAMAEVQPAVYSNSSLKGSYSFLASRWLSDLNEYPSASIGIITFDGSGSVTSSWTVNTEGRITPYSATGTYVMAKDGTGSISLAIPGDITVTEIIVVDSGGKSFQSVETSCTGSDYELWTGTAVAMGTSSFTNATLKGKYGWMMEKWTSNQDPNAYVTQGTMTFDGKGNIKGSSADVSNGTVQSFTFSGTYSVNSDGSGSMTLNLNDASSITIAFMISSANATGTSAKELQLLKTAESPGSTDVQSGTATKQ